jgi:hypothetical protein
MSRPGCGKCLSVDRGHWAIKKSGNGLTALIGEEKLIYK